MFLAFCLILFHTAPCAASPKKPAIPQYIKARFNTVEYRRQIAGIEKLVAMGPRYIPALITMLGDQSRRFRFCSIQALGRYGKAAIPALRRALKNERPLVEMGAVKALGLMGGKARTLVPAILRRLSSKDTRVFLEACRALGRIGMSEAQKIEFLALFRSKNPRTIQGLCRVIARLGQDFPPVLDEYLAKMLKVRKKADLRTWAVRAMASRKLSPVIREALILGLRDKDSGVRSEVARAIILLAKQDTKLLEALLRHFNKCPTAERLAIA
ncbi:MAG: HEAT repeat domain-containing protein, partial [Planctomycetota bacterium]|nr:HEAT repeat domain-containing protein [Planctomycetota bacterium]